MRDVISLLLRAKDDRPLEFIADYFSEVLNGTHVLLREYGFVSKCARDRWAFVQSVREALADLDQDEPTSAAVLTQLLRLVCPDFPIELSTEACRLCGDEAGDHPLGKLLHAVVVRICFADFLARVCTVFRDCDTRGTGRVERTTVGLALRQAAIALAATESCPPAEIFDELIGAAGDIRLIEVEQLLVHSSHMRTMLATPPAAAGPNGTLVASPPPRDQNSASSPGSAYAAAAAAHAAAVGGRRGGARAATRERLAEAAAAAAACAAAGEARAGTRRASSAKTGSRRQSGATRLSSASRSMLQQAAAQAGAPTAR